MAGDVATAGKAGGGVTQEAAGQDPEDRELPAAGNGVTPTVGAPDSRPDAQLSDARLCDALPSDAQPPGSLPAPQGEAPSGNGTAPPATGTAPSESGTGSAESEARTTNSPTRSMPRDLPTTEGFGSGSSGSGHAGVRRRLAGSARPAAASSRCSNRWSTVAPPIRRPTSG